jgi:hypothetical protein
VATTRRNEGGNQFALRTPFTFKRRLDRSGETLDLPTSVERCLHSACGVAENGRGDGDRDLSTALEMTPGVDATSRHSPP